MDSSFTIAALLTPLGRGAVAVIGVRGPRADAAVQQYFRAASGKPIDAQPLGRIVYGRWRAAAGEEVLLVRQASDWLELHCHGGVAAPRAILTDLQCAGCRMAEPWDIPPKDTLDTTQLEAARALAEAPTERTAAILLDQYRGALSQVFAEIEGPPLAGGQSTSGEPSSLKSTERRDDPKQVVRGSGSLHARIDRLLALADVGRHLTRPWRVVLAGRPNVGKSSLINALAGYDRALVFDAPGTTRDSVSATTAIDGWPVELTDTAGIRPTRDALERQAIDQSQQRLAAAELVVLVFDLSQPWSEGDDRLLLDFPGAIVVHNKQDLAADGEASPRPAGLRLSAKTGAGVADLIEVLARRLVPFPPSPGEAVPFTESQMARLLALRGPGHASS